MRARFLWVARSYIFEFSEIFLGFISEPGGIYKKQKQYDGNVPGRSSLNPKEMTEHLLTRRRGVDYQGKGRVLVCLIFVNLNKIISQIKSKLTYPQGVYDHFPILQLPLHNKIHALSHWGPRNPSEVLNHRH